MSCSRCADIQAIDDVPPVCEAGQCPLPSLMPEAARVLKLRSLIIRLRGLVDSAAVLGAMRAGEADMLLLAASEDAVREMDDDRHSG